MCAGGFARGTGLFGKKQTGGGSMRKHLSLIVVAIAMAASLGLSALALLGGSAGALVVDANEHDFGTVKPGELSHTFRLTNRTRHSIEFRGIVKSCGCTEASLPARPLGPSESTAVRCVVDARGRRGKFVSFLRIMYREVGGQDGEQQAVMCILRAKVDAVVSIEPPDVEFTLGRSETKRFQVTSSEPGVKAKAVRCDHAALEAQLGGDGLSFEIAFDASRWKDNEGTVSVDVETSWEPEKVIRVPARIVRQHDE